jgi:transglutaminase-like putative cysteine protease
MPAAAIEAEWVPGDDGLWSLALVALLVGRWLALEEDWGWDAWLPVGASLGLLGALNVASHGLLFLPGGGEASLDFVQRWLVWLEAAFTGGTSEDPDVFLLYAALLCWLVVLLTAWAFYRRQRPLLALLPPVALTAVSVFYSGEGALWLAGEVGCGVLLLGLGTLTRERRAWEAANVDYASGLTLDVLLVTLAAACIVMLLSYSVPYFNVERVSDWIDGLVGGPSDEVGGTAERLFGGVSPPQTDDGADQVATPGVSSYLPRTHLLGGRPETLEEVVMVVRTDEPPPPPVEEFYAQMPYELPPHYWRGATLDLYSGRGWSVTVDDREEMEGELSVPSAPDYREVEQRFEFTAPHGDTIYTLNAPVWIEQPVEMLWRIPPADAAEEVEGAEEREEGDLAGLASEVVSYTVVSRLPAPTANDLRAVPPFYPDEVRERYLQLPETVPQRVIDLAEEVVAGGETVYERARLLERFLRTYPYSLEVERPPEGRDVADYFLFEMREGYCDYYATAFVVMARAVGIPARLAAGFIEGVYDFEDRAYLVRQKDGHSWPEVYFPGWGWIAFEPTGAETVVAFPEEVPLPDLPLPGPPGPPARIVRSRWRIIGVGAGVGLPVWLILVLLVRRRQRRERLVVTVPLVWGWMERAGTRLGLPPDPTLTSQEYATMLGTELRARAGRAQRWQERWMALAARGGATLERLAALYSAEVYGGARFAQVDEKAVRDVWARLRGPLRWLRWLGWVRRERRS